MIWYLKKCLIALKAISTRESIGLNEEQKLGNQSHTGDGSIPSSTVWALPPRLYSLIDGLGFSATGHFCGRLKYRRREISQA